MNYFDVSFHMETKLILLDLDYTLLRSDRTISTRTVQTLANCQKQGIKIGFSTSRGNTNIQQYVDLIHPEVIICNAGACVYYEGKLIHTQDFTLDQTRTLFDAAYKFGGENLEMTCDTLNELYWNRKENKSEQYMPDAIYDDFKDFKHPVFKICIQTTDENVASKIAASVGSDLCDYILFSDIPWFKLAPKTATKENAILYLSEYLKISTDEMVAFGDDFSDIGMLKLCGTGVAMGNAIPQVKEIANSQTLTNDEDGVASYIEKNILKD